MQKKIFKVDQLGCFIFFLTHILQTGSRFESTGGGGRLAYMSVDNTSKVI